MEPLVAVERLADEPGADDLPVEAYGLAVRALAERLGCRPDGDRVGDAEEHGHHEQQAEPGEGLAGEVGEERGHVMPS